MTPLHVAAVGNNVEAVNALLSAGAPLNDKDSSGSTPLMTASCEGHLAVASALIAAGADVNQVNNSGRTALALAVSHNHPDIVSALIAAGVDVNRVHTFGQMKISVLDTVLSHNVHIAALLENAGAKSTLSLMAETSALVEAASRGDIERVNKLIGNAEEEERDMALAVAVDQGMRPMVQCLLAGGANPGTEHLGLRMLSLASIEGDIDVVRDLLDAGADIAFKDHNGQTALQHAAQFQKRDVVALLLAKAKELKNANK
jgi:serine/threonine-protein phosphatase 6 regulatory ankyrin repeat subunit B